MASTTTKRKSVTLADLDILVLQAEAAGIERTPAGYVANIRGRLVGDERSRFWRAPPAGGSRVPPLSQDEIAMGVHALRYALEKKLGRREGQRGIKEWWSGEEGAAVREHARSAGKATTEAARSAGKAIGKTSKAAAKGSRKRAVQQACSLCETGKRRGWANRAHGGRSHGPQSGPLAGIPGVVLLSGSPRSPLEIEVFWPDPDNPGRASPWHVARIRTQVLRVLGKGWGGFKTGYGSWILRKGYRLLPPGAEHW